MKKEILYLSFVDRTLPRNKRWLGGCFVAASNVVEAANEAYRFNCNPGGEVAAFELEHNQECKTEYMNRLLNKKEIEEALRLK